MVIPTKLRLGFVRPEVDSARTSGSECCSLQAALPGSVALAEAGKWDVLVHTVIFFFFSCNPDHVALKLI